jgi:hypothetical protein
MSSLDMNEPPIRGWRAVVDRYREAARLYWEANEAEQRAYAVYSQICPPLPSELRQVLYFTEDPCTESYEFLDQRVVAIWAKRKGLSAEGRARLEAAFVAWDEARRIVEQDVGLKGAAEAVQQALDRRQLTYTALLETPTLDLDTLAEKVAIAAELNDGFALDHIARDIRRLAARLT